MYMYVHNVSSIFFPIFRWSFLKIEGNPTVDSDTELALAAGMAEGAATGAYACCITYCHVWVRVSLGSFYTCS